MACGGGNSHKSPSVQDLRKRLTIPGGLGNFEFMAFLLLLLTHRWVGWKALPHEGAASSLNRALVGTQGPSWPPGPPQFEKNIQARSSPGKNSTTARYDTRAILSRERECWGREGVQKEGKMNIKGGGKEMERAKDQGKESVLQRRQRLRRADSTADRSRAAGRSGEGAPWRRAHARAGSESRWLRLWSPVPAGTVSV